VWGNNDPGFDLMPGDLLIVDAKMFFYFDMEFRILCINKNDELLYIHKL